MKAEENWLRGQEVVSSRLAVCDYGRKTIKIGGCQWGKKKRSEEDTDKTTTHYSWNTLPIRSHIVFHRIPPAPYSCVVLTHPLLHTTRASFYLPLPSYSCIILLPK